MDYNNISEKEKEALHIADVSESVLCFTTEQDGLLRIRRGDDYAGFRIFNEETMYLNEQQIIFLVRWLQHSR